MPQLIEILRDECVGNRVLGVCRVNNIIHIAGGAGVACLSDETQTHTDTHFLYDVLNDQTVLKVGLDVNHSVYTTLGIDGLIDLSELRDQMEFVNDDNVVVEQLINARNAVAYRDAFLYLFDHRCNLEDINTPYEWMYSLTSQSAMTSTEFKARKKSNIFKIRQHDLYEHCLLTAPDGTPLSFINRRRKMYYIRQGLAELDEDVLHVTAAASDLGAFCVLRLNFEPSSRPSSSIVSVCRRNRCVVCGAINELLRVYIVPHSYRRYFALSLKSRDSHDVMPMCRSCHVIFNEHCAKLSQQLALQYSAPLSSASKLKASSGNAAAVKKAALALLRHRKHMPLPRRSHLEQIVLAALSNTSCSTIDSILNDQDTHSTVPPELTDELLKRYATQQTHERNLCVHRSHYELVVAACENDDGGINAFVQRWRRSFLNTMQPRHLPEDWCVEQPIGNNL